MFFPRPCCQERSAVDRGGATKTVGNQLSEAAKTVGNQLSEASEEFSFRGSMSIPHVRSICSEHGHHSRVMDADGDGGY